MNLAFIVACTEDGLIGCEGALLWRLPADMRRFKSLSKGHTVLMGRKTYDSLHIRPLPERRNIVLSGDRSFRPPGCETIARIEQLSPLLDPDREQCFIIGGGEVFEQFLPYVRFIYQTLVYAHLDGDTWFPKVSPEEWSQDGGSCYHPADNSNNYAMTFIKWRRRGKASPLPLGEDGSF